MLYLDYAASAPIRSGALKILESSMRESFANPSSAHKLGKDIQRQVEACRQQMLSSLDAPAGGRLIFTSSATESNNTAIAGLGLSEGDTITLSFADHPSVTEPVKHLWKKGINVQELPLLKNGIPDQAALLKGLNNEIKLVILTQVNNQSGAITDIASLSREIKKINPAIHIHVDAAQGFGKIPLSLKETDIDTLAISSHKIGGPKGIAALYLRPEVNISPLLFGGGQEDGLRSSTLAAPLVFSFCQAAKEAMEHIQPALARMSELNHSLQANLKKELKKITLPFAEHSSPYILTFLLPGISSDIILRHLEQKDIIISSTAACSSKIKGTQPVFTALHLPPDVHKFVLRASFSDETTVADIDLFCRTLAEIYHELERFMR